MTETGSSPPPVLLLLDVLEFELQLLAFFFLAVGDGEVDGVAGVVGWAAVVVDFIYGVRKSGIVHLYG